MPPATRELWFYILRKVNHRDNGKLKRGQGFFNITDVIEDLSWFVGFRKMTYSKDMLVKALRRLREGGMIASMKTSRGIIITVCKYDIYQDPKNYEDTNEGFTKASRRLHEGIHYKQEGRRKKEESTKLHSANKNFQKPTFEQVAAYCIERENNISPEAFIAHYESNGWKVGKNPMKCWKSAVVTWEKNERKINGQSKTFSQLRREANQKALKEFGQGE